MKFLDSNSEMKKILPLEFVRNKKILIIGNYGDGNLGDEAILKSLITYLHDYDIHKIYVPTKNVSFLNLEFKNYHNVIPIHYLSLIKILKAFLASNTIIIGGGGIYSKYSGLGVYLSTILSTIIKTFFKKGLVFLSIGYSTTTPKLLKLISKYAFIVADLISVRDKKSRENIIKLGIKNKKVITTVDLTLLPFLSLPGPEYGKKLLEENGIDMSKLLVGIALNGTKDNEINKRIVGVFSDIIKWLLDKYDATIIFFQFCPAYVSKMSDKIFVEEIISKLPQYYKERCKLLDYYPPEIVMSIIQHLKLLIGMRFHSLIFAYRMNIPFIGISYEEKCSNFLQEIGKKIFRVESINTTELKTEIYRILGD